MCEFSELRIPSDLPISSTSGRPANEPCWAAFYITKVNGILKNFPLAHIAIGVDNRGLNPNFQMWAIDEAGTPLSSETTSADFPCPTSCFEKAKVKAKEKGKLIPDNNKFCRNHVNQVLLHPTANCLVIHYVENFQNLCMYPATIDLSTQVIARHHLELSRASVTKS